MFDREQFDRNMRKMDKQFDTVFYLATAGTIISFLFSLMVAGGILYVIWHFLQKIW